MLEECTSQTVAGAFGASFHIHQPTQFQCQPWRVPREPRLKPTVPLQEHFALLGFFAWGLPWSFRNYAFANQSSSEKGLEVLLVGS